MENIASRTSGSTLPVRTRLMALRGLLLTLGVVLMGYLIAEIVLLARGYYPRPTLGAWLPLVIFNAAVAAGIVWEIRNTKRRALIEQTANPKAVKLLSINHDDLLSAINRTVGKDSVPSESAQSSFCN